MQTPDTETGSTWRQADARTALWAGGLVFAAAALLYLRTVAPSVLPGDYAEFQMCAAVLGVPHPTGYPLYILLTKLFTLLPFGDVAYRVNISSSLFMAGAAALLYTAALLVIRRLGSRAWWWAAGCALLFVAAPTVWSMALVARSYALNALLVGSVVTALLLWRGTRQSRYFYLACLLIGLSMVHHGTTYLLLPGYGIYLLVVEWERRETGTNAPYRRWALGAAALALGYSPMLFLVYRFVAGSPYYWGNPTTWKDFFSLLTGGPFHNQVMGYGWGSQIERLAFGIGELSTQYTPVGIALGAAGAVALWWRSRPEAALLTLMLAGNFLFAMNYSLVGYLYFIPTYLIWAMFMSVGLAAAGIALAGLVRGAAGAPAAALRGAAAVGLVAAAVFAGSVRYASLDRSGQTSTRDQALALLGSLPQGASVYLDWEALSVLRFYRLVYGMRPDLTMRSGDPADWAKWVYCDVTTGTPAYVGEFAGEKPPVIARDFTLESGPMASRVTGVTNDALYKVPACGTCATCR